MDVKRHRLIVVSNRLPFVFHRDKNGAWRVMNIAMELRNLGCTSRIGFFLHIPFPPLDLFVKLPWCARLINALLEYDLVGFQTSRDRRNFVQCVKALVKDAQI